MNKQGLSHYERLLDTSWLHLLRKYFSEWYLEPIAQVEQYWTFILLCFKDTEHKDHIWWHQIKWFCSIQWCGKSDSNVSQLVCPLLWCRLKYLHNYWLNCHEICRHPRRMNCTDLSDPLTFCRCHKDFVLTHSDFSQIGSFCLYC